MKINISSNKSRVGREGQMETTKREREKEQEILENSLYIIQLQE